MRGASAFSCGAGVVDSLNEEKRSSCMRQILALRLGSESRKTLFFVADIEVWDNARLGQCRWFRAGVKCIGMRGCNVVGVCLSIRDEERKCNAAAS